MTGPTEQRPTEVREHDAPGPGGGTLLEVQGLRTEFPGARGPLVPVDDVSLRLGRGETLGLVGESGSGKTMTLMSIGGLLPPPGRIAAGSVLFDGMDLTEATAAQLRAVRGRDLGIIFQDPMTGLNPTLTVGFQVAEPLRLHQGLSRKAAQRAAVEMLGEVGIPRPSERLQDYPHQFSGGMRQRVMIAAALVCQPKLVLADEPTTALDVTVQAQILDLLAQLAQETGTALILVTHDLGVAATVCDRIAVMYAGQIVESGPTDTIFENSRMPYTTGLMDCIPHLDDEPGTPLKPIAGLPPDISMLAPGCHFADRCTAARSVCRVEEPSLSERGPMHLARCLGTEPGGWLDAG